MEDGSNNKIKQLLAEAYALAGDARSIWMDALRQRDQEAAAEVASLLRFVEETPGDFHSPFAGIAAEEIIAPGRILRFRYRIVAKAGAGATSEVFEAEDLLLAKRRVAIKIMKQGLFGEQWRIAEIATLAALNHSAIASVLDSGTLGDGRGFLVTRFAKGKTLAEAPGLSGDDPKAIGRLGRKIGEALEYAHQRGILHRDIRPANIIIDDWGGPKESVVLIDFGLAICGSKPGTIRANHAQHDRYQAPEAQSGEYSPTSDLYSASLVLQELFAGRKPPGSWRRFFRNSLIADPAKRPRTAADWVGMIPSHQTRRASVGLLAAIAGVVALFAWLAASRASAPPDWTASTPVTTRVGAENWPVWAPDSQTVYFLQKSPPNDGAIFQLDMASGTVSQILGTSANRSHLALSKDGTFLLFLEYGDQGRTAIISFELTSKRRHTQAEGFINSFGVGARTGLFYVSARTGPRTPHRLYLLDARDGSWSPLTDPKSGYGDIHPQLHPNGDHLLFVRQISPGHFAPFISGVETNGPLRGVPRQLGTGFPTIRTPRWLGNSRSIAMVAGSPASQTLWHAVNGGAPREISIAGHDLRELAVSNDGKSLIVSRTRADPNIYRAVKRGGSWVLTPFASSSRSDDMPVLSQDGKWLAFISDRSGQNQVWVTELGSNHIERIRTAEVADLAGLSWEPDGKRLIVTIPIKEKVRHLAYEPSSGNLDDVQLEGTFAVPSINRDSYLTHLDSGTTDPGWWRIFYDRRPPVLVAPGKRVAITEAFDGSAVYYSIGPDFEGVYKRDSAGNVEKLLASYRIHREMLQARRTGLYFATLEGSQYVVWHFEFATRRVNRLFSSKAPMGVGLSVSSDESEIYLTITDAGDTDLYLLREKPR